MLVICVLFIDISLILSELGKSGNLGEPLPNNIVPNLLADSVWIISIPSFTNFSFSCSNIVPFIN